MRLHELMNSARSHSDSSLSVPLHCTPLSTIGRTTPSGNVGRGEKKLPRRSGAKSVPTRMKRNKSSYFNVNNYVLGNCCWLQTTVASVTLKSVLQTVPQRPPTQYSSRPSLELSPPARRTSVELHSAASLIVNTYVVMHYAARGNFNLLPASQTDL